MAHESGAKFIYPAFGVTLRQNKGDEIMENYNGKVAVITGGTSGLGYAFAESLGKKGCHVVITGRNVQKGEDAKKQLLVQNIDVMYVQHDVADETSWDNVIMAVKSQFNEIHYLFNNAGVMMRAKPNVKLTMNDWKWVIETNMWGALYGLRKFTEIMLAQECEGRIVTTASTAAVAPFSMWSPYSVSKVAVVRMVECYQSETKLLKNDKIKYSVSFPGVFESDISNTTVYRNDKYKNEGEHESVEAASKAGTPEGDKLGKLTAKETAQIILDQLDEGNTYIFTHPDLTTALVLEQTNAVLLNKPVVDQAIFDFEFYAKKLAKNGLVTDVASVEQLGAKQAQ